MVVLCLFFLSSGSLDSSTVSLNSLLQDVLLLALFLNSKCQHLQIPEASWALIAGSTTLIGLKLHFKSFFVALKKSLWVLCSPTHPEQWILPLTQLLFFLRPSQALSRWLHAAICGQALWSSGGRAKLQALKIQQWSESKARAKGEPRTDYWLWFSVVWWLWRQHWYSVTLSSSREVHLVMLKVQEKRPFSMMKCVSLYLSVLFTFWWGS